MITTINRNVGVLIPIGAFALIIGVLSSINPELAAVLATAIIILSIALSVYSPLGFYVCSIVMNISFTPAQSALLALVTGLICLNILYKNISLYRQTSYIQFFFLFLILLFISLITGQNSTTMAAITSIYTLLTGFTVGCYLPKNKELYISYSLLFGGIVVMFLVYRSLRSGTAIDFNATEGRLRYGDSVRILANALAYPVYISFLKMVEYIRSKNYIKSAMWFALAMSCFYFLILTVSRGVIFAVLLALMYVMSKTMKTGGSSKIIVVIVIAVVAYFINSMSFNQSYMMNGLDTMTGRDLIWGFYWNELMDGGIVSILFGFGPGEVSRISANSIIEGAYAHSLVLDYLFRYGVLGFLFLISLLTYIGYKLIKTNSVFYIGLLIMSILMFATHGSANTPLFYYLIGMCIGRTLIPKDYANVLNIK